MRNSEKKVIIVAASLVISVILVFVIIFAASSSGDKPESLPADTTLSQTQTSENRYVSGVEVVEDYKWKQVRTYLEGADREETTVENTTEEYTTEEYTAKVFTTRQFTTRQFTTKPFTFTTREPATKESATKEYTTDSSADEQTETTRAQSEAPAFTPDTPIGMDITARLYAYELLDENGKGFYRTVCNAIENFETTVDVERYAINPDELNEHMWYVLSDQPGYFWCSYSWNCTINRETNVLKEIFLNYWYTEEQVRGMQAQIDSVVAAIDYDIKPGMSEYEIALDIYESVINIIDYDSIGLSQQKEYDANKPDELRNIYGGLVNKKSVCVGYAKVLQYLLQKYGIESVYLSNEGHAWNLAKIDGDYYHIDATFGDGSNTDPELNLSEKVNYAYLCMTTQQVNKLEYHYMGYDMELPECTSEKYDYYKVKGAYLETADYGNYGLMLQKCMLEGKNSLTVKCKNEQVLTEMMNGPVWDCVIEVANRNNLEVPERIIWRTFDDKTLLELEMFY